MFGRENVLIVSNSAGTQNDAGLIHVSSNDRATRSASFANALYPRRSQSPITLAFQSSRMLPKSPDVSSLSINTSPTFLGKTRHQRKRLLWLATVSSPTFSWPTDLVTMLWGYGQQDSGSRKACSSEGSKRRFWTWCSSTAVGVARTKPTCRCSSQSPSQYHQHPLWQHHPYGSGTFNIRSPPCD